MLKVTTYHGLIKSVQSYINTTRTSSKYNTLNWINYPFLPYTTSFLYKSKTGGKYMYNIIISKNGTEYFIYKIQTGIIF